MALPAVCFAQFPEGFSIPETPENTFITGVSLDRVAGTISWYQDLPVDYDQNGEVNQADVSALVRHFGDSTKGEWGYFSIHSILDGDNNKEINLADITPIVLNYGASITSFEIFQSNSPINGGLVLNDGIMVVPYSASPGNPTERRRSFKVQVPIGPSPFVYIAAVNQDGFLGNKHLVHEHLYHTPRLHSPFYGLAWNEETQSLLWFRRTHGDGDRNGEVNFADYIPIGNNLGSSGPFEPGSDVWYADYNGDGTVDIADKFVVDTNFGAWIDGYLFYSTTNPDELPEPYSYPVLTPFEQVDLSGFNPPEFGSISGLSGEYVWLRPYFGDPSNPVNVGPPSEFVLVP